MGDPPEQKTPHVPITESRIPAIGGDEELSFSRTIEDTGRHTFPHPDEDDTSDEGTGLYGEGLYGEGLYGNSDALRDIDAALIRWETRPGRKSQTRVFEIENDHEEPLEALIHQASHAVEGVDGTPVLAHKHRLKRFRVAPGESATVEKFAPRRYSRVDVEFESDPGEGEVTVAFMGRTTTHTVSGGETA